MAAAYTPDEELLRAMRRTPPPYAPDPQLTQAMRPRPAPTGTSMVVAGPRTTNPDPLGRAPRTRGAPVMNPDRFTPEQMAEARKTTNMRMDGRPPTPNSAPPAAGANPPAAGAARRLGGGLLRTAGKVAPAVTAGAVASQSSDDYDSGFYEHQQQLLGANADGPGARTMAGDLGRSALKTASDLGDTLTFGLAGRVGRGIANYRPGDIVGSSFAEGFMSPSDRTNYQNAQAQQAATVAARIDPSRRRGGAPMVGSNDRGRDNAVVGADQTIVGSFNGDALAIDAPAAGAASGAPAMRRSSVTATPGYQAQNLSGSRAPSDEDRRRLYHDLVTIGRGSPSMRQALMQRYNDSFNNYEEGKNQRANTDLAAGAHSANEFADRRARADLANQVDNRERDEFEGELEIKRANAMNMGDIVDMMAADAEAKRKNDAYALGRDETQDAYNDELRAGIIEQNMAAGMDSDAAGRDADAQIARRKLATGQGLTDTTEIAGGVELAERPARALDGDTSWDERIFDWRNPFTQDDKYLGGEVDLSQVKHGPRENVFGIDASTMNYLPGIEMDEYYAEIPASDGKVARGHFKTKEEYDAWLESLTEGQRAQSALPRRGQR